MNHFQKSDYEPAFDEFVYRKREERWAHLPYEEELAILDMIRSGDFDSLSKYPRGEFYPKYSYLSDNPLRQKKYEFVASVTVVTRVAVEAGLDMETAYALSDSYIRLVDKINDMDKIRDISQKMSVAYAKK